MDWLNNGEVKYFKSPAEGSYLVRLMNVSLTPNDQLGRMLHTFNATAYEVGDINKINLEKYKFILPDRFVPSNNTVSLNEINLEAHQSVELNNILNLEFFVNQHNDGTININSEYQDKINSDLGTKININENEIFIPAYIQNYSLNVDYDSVTIKSFERPISIVYTYKNTNTVHDSRFEDIKAINQIYTPNLQIRQLNGLDNPCELNVKESLEYGDSLSKKEIAFFSFLQFYKNPDIEKAMEWDKNNFKIEINGTIIDLKDTRSYQLTDIDYVTSLNIEPGIILECGYYLNHIEFKGG